jgi:hypothetical protein
MVHGWMKRVSNSLADLYQGEGKGGWHPPAFLWHMGSRLHAVTGCRKVYAWIVFE